MIKQIDNNGIHYISEGEGSPVVLFHGMAASLYDWESLRSELANAGFQTFTPDLPGHGESIKPDDPEEYTVSNVYQRMEAWIDRLSLSFPMRIIGHSLGGYLGLKYTLSYPERVRSLVLINPFYSPSQLNHGLRFFSQFPQLGEKVFHLAPDWLFDAVLGMDPTNANQFSKQAIEQIAMDYKRAAPQIVYLGRNLDDLTPDLRRITAPTLVIWGDRDLTLDPASFPALVSRLPLGRDQLLFGSGHQPHIGLPQEVNRAIMEFFAGN